ncbi:MAG: hypothetical protein V8T00_05515 [Oscillospiraceae bacterium]
MKKQNLYLSSIAPDAPEAAKEYGLGLELAQFCTAAFLDSPETAGSLFLAGRIVREFFTGILGGVPVFI